MGMGISLIEVVNELKKIRGKFLQDEGIYVFSKPALAVITNEQQITTSPWWSDAIDLSSLGFKMFYIENTEDVSVFVDFYSLPSLNSSIQAPIRTNVEVKPNDVVMAIMKDRHIAGKLRFYTTSPPSSGYVNCILASWSLI